MIPDATTLLCYKILLKLTHCRSMSWNYIILRNMWIFLWVHATNIPIRLWHGNNRYGLISASNILTCFVGRVSNNFSYMRHSNWFMVFLGTFLNYQCAYDYLFKYTNQFCFPLKLCPFFTIDIVIIDGINVTLLF